MIITQDWMVYQNDVLSTRKMELNLPNGGVF